MKKILLLLALPVAVFATDKSINEETVVTHIHYLYKKVKIKGDKVEVRGPMLSKRIKPNEEASESFRIKQRKFEITLAELEFEKKLADSTFTAISNDGTGMGTAVYIGGNYILTNLHVYNREYETPACNKFKVKTNPELGSKSFSCKKLIKCKKSLDYCLVEMKVKDGKSLGDYVVAPPVKIEFEPPGIVRLIGNIKGKGFQASAGNGIIRRGSRYLHQAPLFKGASGGPLFNDFGDLIGINYAESKILKGSKAKNFAIPLFFIKKDLEKTVSKEVLDQLLL